MEAYSADVEAKMQRLFAWLSEKDRRRYAAVEAVKLGHGASSTSRACSPATPRRFDKAWRDLEEPADPAPARVRKKGVDADR